MPRTQDADLNLIQDFLELFPTRVIGFRDIENDGLTLSCPPGTRRCVERGYGSVEEDRVFGG